MELDESMFNVDISIYQNKLRCEIFFSEFTFNNLEYAFYLLHNEVKIETRHYTTDNFCEFELINDGEYSVVGFIKCGDKKVIKNSISANFKCDNDYQVASNELKKNSIPISIFGSCVSRDTLEFDKLKKLNLKTYIARQSIISSVSIPISCSSEDITIKSNFQRKMVYSDLTKNTFDFFEHDGSKYLIVDLIDERFKIVNYRKSSITLSNEFKSTNFYEKHKNEIIYKQVYKIKNWKIYKLKKKFTGFSYMYGDVLLEKLMDKFCNRIKNIYGDENIIIHKAYMLNNYIDIDGKVKEFPQNYIDYNQKINERLKYMYEYFQFKLPKAFVVDICNNFYADENHKWGLAPMHYQKEYYGQVINQIIERIFNLAE